MGYPYIYRLSMGYPMRLVKLTVKAIRVGNSVRVAIPSEVLQAAGVKVGDTLVIDYDEKEHQITLEKKTG
jgi:bifunctional DNA-binding transcriptional regulator/antitoxin component of YhaV-PrlF toxin-antitoxin module